MKTFLEWMEENRFGHDLGREAQIDTGPSEPSDDYGHGFDDHYIYQFKCLGCNKVWFDESGREDPEECPFCSRLDGARWPGKDSAVIEPTGNKMEIEQYRKKFHPHVDPEDWRRNFHSYKSR